ASARSVRTVRTVRPTWARSTGARDAMPGLSLQALAVNAQRSRSVADVAPAVGEHARDVLPLDLVERQQLRRERHTALDPRKQLARRDRLARAIIGARLHRTHRLRDR